MTLPKSLQKYFWDIDPKKVDVTKKGKYFINRLLELGNMQAINWVNKSFDKKTILDTIKTTKLSPKSKNFWQHIYGLKILN